jgi:hypothetical protein
MKIKGIYRETFSNCLKTLLLTYCVLYPGLQNSHAQQNVNFRANIVSPIVNEEGTVTFKLNAPNAQNVTVNGDWESRTGQITKDSAGDEEAWITLGRTAYIMDNLISEGKIVPMIVVMPNGNPSKQAVPGETTENFSYGPAMSQFLPRFADFLYNSTQEHLKILDKLQFPYTYVESESGPIWSNWRKYMLQFTPLLFNE